MDFEKFLKIFILPTLLIYFVFIIIINIIGVSNRVDVLEKYHENEHYCPYCNSVIDNVKEI